MAFVLVTGINGFIGGYIARALIDSGYEVLGLDRRGSCRVENCKYYQADIRDFERVEKVFDQYEISTIIHLAALVHDRSSYATTENYLNTNFEAVKGIFDIAKKKNVSTVLFSSTIEVYGPPEEKFITEAQVCKPLSQYSRTKLLAEEYIESIYKDTDFKWGIMRIAPVYAPEYLMNIDKRIKLPYLPIGYYFRDGSYSFHFCSIFNIVQFVLAYLDEKNSERGYFNISDIDMNTAKELLAVYKKNNRIKFTIKLPYTIAKMIIFCIEKVSRRITNKDNFFSVYNFEKLFRTTKYDSTRAQNICGMTSDLQTTLK